MTSGAGGYEPGQLVLSDTSTLTREQTSWFLGNNEENKFRDMARVDKSRMGTDGAEWIFEGEKNGSYHILNRWSPDDEPVRVIGLAMLRSLAKVKIPPKKRTKITCLGP